MSELRVNRTLVKSPPELWPELSEVQGLANHLGEFGEISITRLEPEHVVVWEAERASGTVELESSAEGTRVTLTAEIREAELARAPSPSRPLEQVIPDLDAWERRAAEVEVQASRQTAAALRAAERAAIRAEREGKRRRGRFRGRRSEPEGAGAFHRPTPEPAPVLHRQGASAFAAQPGATEEHARSVLETALDRLGTSSAA